MKLKTIANLLTMCAVMMSCSEDIENEPTNEMVTLTFSPYEMESMTRATSSIADSIRQRTFSDVPVTRNRITTYTGHFFQNGDGEFTQSDFGFVVHTDWDGEEEFEF